MDRGQWFKSSLGERPVWLEDLMPHVISCTQPNSVMLNITMKGTLTLYVKGSRQEHTLKLTDVYYEENVVHNLLSYGTLDMLGVFVQSSTWETRFGGLGRRRVVFDVDLRKKVLVVQGFVKLQKAPNGVIIAVLEEEAHGTELSPDVQQGTLLDFHKRLGHLNWKRFHKFKSLGSRSRITSKAKQSKNRLSKKDSGAHSPIDCIVGVICSDLKEPMTPKIRLRNRYMFNFVDHKNNYVRVFLANMKDQAAKKFEHFLIAKTDSGGEYENVDVFCKTTNVAMQRSEANNQASSGKSERMHGSVMNMARCMIFACGLPLSFLGDAM
ncbi:LOW QUALITY PROTEIN: hypothetical protein PHMEG_00018620 [Phytophthora megakarya]|uniref:Uncharacterized protein n=1 Tax=Phytophthora megakarya TaxID=4795 RepID=A0A225VVG0_9STRA|nr:LOW QUALITY PROTEIN: hypothetical protein PHMEG_00018620 [Phytophthora megakarya]